MNPCPIPSHSQTSSQRTHYLILWYSCGKHIYDAFYMPNTALSSFKNISWLSSWPPYEEYPTNIPLFEDDAAYSPCASQMKLVLQQGRLYRIQWFPSLFHTHICNIHNVLWSSQLISTCHWVVKGLCRAHSFKTLNGRSLSSWILGRKDPGMTKRTHRGRREITDVSRPLGRWASGTRLEFADERLAPRREEQEGVDGNYVSLRSRHRTCNCLQRGKGSTCHRVSFNWHLRIGSCTALNTKSHSVVIFIGHATVH